MENTQQGLSWISQKRIDTINIQILLDKLHKHGIRGKPWEWFRNYLSNRQQRVIINDEKNKLYKSKLNNITHGVPQGSVLGPILFLVYINDIGTTVNNAKLISFADDTTLYITHECFEDLYINLYDDVVTVLDWFNANKLSINMDKTKYMLFHPTNKKREIDIPELIINNIKIERVNSFKFLGITIDNTLNWNKHVDNITTKIKQNNYLLNNIKHLIPIKSMRTMYYAHIFSHLNYGISVWGQMLNITQLNKIDREHKKSVRYVTKNKYKTNYNKLYKELKILKLDDIIKSETLKFTYRVNNDLLPSSCKHYLITKLMSIHIIQEGKTI